VERQSSRLDTRSQLSLTGGKLLLRNTLWNVLGQVLPLIFALISIPLLIKALGTDRFGILSLAWAVIGYFSFFDLGLGRALTKMVAEQLGLGEEEQIPPLIWTALLLMLLLGTVGSLILLTLSSWLTNDALRIPEALRIEAMQSFMLLAISIPIVIITSGLSGILAAKQCFGLINTVRIPFGALMTAGPLLIVPFSHQLQPIIVILLIIRVVNLLILLKLCFRIFPNLRRHVHLSINMVKKLINYGGWMTVSNVVSPLMVYADRFLISALISMAAVAYYTTPYEVITKLWIIPSALVGVLFPAFSTSFANDIDRTMLLCKKSLKYVFITLFPITLIIVAYSYEGLVIWLGPKFAQSSFHVLRWLSLGVFINSFGQVVFVLVQGAGRPDMTAKAHLIEIPFYAVMVWLFVKAYGIEGAAIAWVLRIVVDTVFLFFMSRRLLSGSSFRLLPYFAGLSFSLIALCLVCLVTSIVIKTFMTLIILTSFALIIWSVFLTKDEKLLFMSYLKPVFLKC